MLEAENDFVFQLMKVVRWNFAWWGKMCWRLTEVNELIILDVEVFLKFPQFNSVFYIIKENVEMYRVHSFA